MKYSAIIKSAHDGTTLEFSDSAADYYDVCVSGPNIRGTTVVYAYEPMHSALFFRDLANHWKGWTGKKEWRSLEGEFSLAATIDLTGHITLSAQLRSGPYPSDWMLSTVLLLEAGQLERVASLIEKFVADITSVA